MDESENGTLSPGITEAGIEEPKQIYYVRKRSNSGIGRWSTLPRQASLREESRRTAAASRFPVFVRERPDYAVADRCRVSLIR